MAVALYYDKIVDVLSTTNVSMELLLHTIGWCNILTRCNECSMHINRGKHERFQEKFEERT